MQKAELISNKEIFLEILGCSLSDELSPMALGSLFQSLIARYFNSCGSLMLRSPTCIAVWTFQRNAQIEMQMKLILLKVLVCPVIVLQRLLFLNLINTA